MKTVCLHGAESTGKSTLAATLEARCGWPWVPEHGRVYCEEHGTDLTMADLIAIAEGQGRANRRAMEAARENGAPVLLLDTDQLMTAAWARMLFGEVPPSLLAWPRADLYLLFEADVPWHDDGTRLFGTPEARRRFAQVSQEVLERAGVPFVRIAGGWDERGALAQAAIMRLIEEG